MRRCGNEVLMHRSKPDVNWSNYYWVCFVSFLSFFLYLSTNLMLNRDKTKKKRKEKMWVERLSFVFVYTCTLSFLNADAPFQINLCLNTHTHIQSNKHDHYMRTLYVSKLPYLFRLVASLDICIYIFFDPVQHFLSFLSIHLLI